MRAAAHGTVEPRHSTEGRDQPGHGTNGESTELELRVLGLLREGDSDAAATWVLEALGPGVLAYLAARLPHDEANDAFSHLQQDVWRGLPGFRWECSLRGWVYRLAGNAAARVARDGYRRRKQPLPSDLACSLPAPDPVPDAGGRRDQLAFLRDELAPDERILLALRIGRGLAWNEVSAILAVEGETISSAALRKRFERLKEKLVTLARERGLLS